jgi:hypothetical protein
LGLRIFHGGIVTPTGSNLLGTKKERKDCGEKEIGAFMFSDPYKIMLEDVESFNSLRVWSNMILKKCKLMTKGSIT